MNCGETDEVEECLPLA